ncbi:MAG: biotin/lipoyl-containing protein, partial [Melioribacteraceae bacterium]|nr:biotin/lipoyl-containing protein [Melioribacteraceae bacterium]
MKVDIIMPKMGESINEGTIIKWHKKVGDSVKKDEIIYEISTDKVDTEIPSPTDGVLVEIKAYEHETVPINEVVAVIETNGEAVAAEAVEIEEEPSTDQVGSIVDLPMPKMGESVVEGTIIKWHKKVGDEVKVDEIVYEISTDKVDTEVPSPVDGVIAEILFPENEVVEVGVTVAKISTKSGYKKVIEESSVATEAEEKDKAEETEVKEEITRKEVTPLNKEESEKIKSSSKFFSPLVLNIAREEGVSAGELESIKGSGIGGRVTKKDLLNYLKNKGTVQSTPAPEIKRSVSTSAIETIPMDNIRKKIMEHMIRSRDTSVHVTEIMEVDMTVIHNYIEKNRERLLKDDNLKLTYMAFISYAAIRALKEY